MKHTPTPWRVVETKKGIEIHEDTETTPIRIVSQNRFFPFSKVDAEFIVRAVNNHDQLIEALEGVVLAHESVTISEWLEESIEKAKAALAAIKEES